MLRMTAHDAYNEATRQEDCLFSTIKTNWRLIYETTNSTRSAGVE